VPASVFVFDKKTNFGRVFLKGRSPRELGSRAVIPGISSVKRTLLNSKIHRATVTGANLHYVGSQRHWYGLSASNEFGQKYASTTRYPMRFKLPLGGDQSEQLMDSTFQAKAQSSPSLFCFPYAGAGASAFASWADLMPPEVELCAVQLPGRESRLREKPFVRLPPLVRAVRESLRPYLHKPFAFFGHSMGALISFELARELRRTLWRWFRRRAWKPSGASFPRPLPRGVAVATTDLQARIDQWINFKSAAAAEPGAKAAALHARPELGVDCVAPRNETEQTIAGIWPELLGIEPIGVHDNFFELGGQSLLATQVVARVRTALKTDLPLRRFFEEPTVAELAHAILPEKNGQSSAKPQESAAIASV